MRQIIWNRRNGQNICSRSRKPFNEINLPEVSSSFHLWMYFKVISGRWQKPTSDFRKGPRELYEPFCFTRRNLRAEPTWVPLSKLWHSDQIYGQIHVIMVIKLEEITSSFRTNAEFAYLMWDRAAAPNHLTTCTRRRKLFVSKLTFKFKIETIESNNRLVTLVTRL